MSNIRTIASILALAALFSGAIEAQKKSTSRTTTAKSAAPKATSTLPPLDVRAARVKVSNQASNVEQFVNIMGPIAQSIEALDSESKTRKIAETSAQANEANKQKLIAAIKNMRTGIDTLESEFQTKPALKIYLSKIQGISQLAAQSESLASTGKFVLSRDPWKTILQKLNDTLAAMPTAEL